MTPNMQQTKQLVFLSCGIKDSKEDKHTDKNNLKTFYY